MGPDPLGWSIADPQSLNRYAYVLGDPVNLVDPLGPRDCPNPTPSGCGIVSNGAGGFCPADYCDTNGAPRYTLNGIPISREVLLRLVAVGMAIPPGEANAWVEIYGPVKSVFFETCTDGPGRVVCWVTQGFQTDVWGYAWNGSASDIAGFLEMVGGGESQGQAPAGGAGPLLGFVPNFPPGMNPQVRAGKPQAPVRTTPELEPTPANEPPPELPIENEGLKRLLGLVAQFLSGLEGGILRDFTLPFAVIPQNGYCTIDPASCAVPSGTY